MSTNPQTSDVFQGKHMLAASAEPTVINAVFTSRRVLVSDSRSEWIEALEKRFNDLTALPVGWDGYTGRPVSFTIARFAANLLERLYVPNVPPPSLVPGADGSLQIEWHRNDYDVELDIVGPQKVVAYRHDCQKETDEELELATDFTPIQIWIEDLSFTGRRAARKKAAKT